MIFRCVKYDYIRKKAFNDKNAVDNVKLKVGNKREKLKRFLPKAF